MKDLFVRVELFPLSDRAAREELVKDSHPQQPRAPAEGLSAPERHGVWDSPAHCADWAWQFPS